MCSELILASSIIKLLISIMCLTIVIPEKHAMKELQPKSKLHIMKKKKEKKEPHAKNDKVEEKELHHGKTNFTANND
jgi:hypothetical protein